METRISAPSSTAFRSPSDPASSFAGESEALAALGSRANGSSIEEVGSVPGTSTTSPSSDSNHIDDGLDVDRQDGPNEGEGIPEVSSFSDASDLGNLTERDPLQSSWQFAQDILDGKDVKIADHLPNSQQLLKDIEVYIDDTSLLTVQPIECEESSSVDNECLSESLGSGNESLEMVPGTELCK